MPLLTRKRRSEVRHIIYGIGESKWADGPIKQIDAPDSSASGESPPQRRRVQRDDSDGTARSADSENETQVQTQTTSGVETMVRKLVRLAISSEYARTPIRRGDISAKVLGEGGSRQFRVVFEKAQNELRTVFGMQLEELPSREKFTISQRRGTASSFKLRPVTTTDLAVVAAQTSQKAPASSSKAWILTSTLPPEYKFNADILPPTKAPSDTTEAIYTAFYSFIISLILMNNGSLPEAKLERYLRRANADQWTPIMSTEKLLQRLAKDGYLEKRRDTSSGEEIIEWVVGPRGKIEVGVKGVQGFVKAVYGESGEDDEELDRELQRSLGIQQRQQPDIEDAEDETPQVNGDAQQARARRGGARRGYNGHDDDL